MSESVANEIRDSVMENKILIDPQNHLCFDCGSKEPKWASPYLGIIICYECAARHRSYGAHISFVRSIDLDKWNKRQLKTLEITGNNYTKEKFAELGIPKKGSVYDYESDLILKYRGQLEEKVREILSNENCYDSKPKTDSNNKKKDNDVKKIENEEVKKVEPEKKEDKKEIEEKPKEEELKPTKFEIKQKAKVNVIKVEGKAGKKNKIKKVDFDFDFDSFNDVNFAELNQPKEEKEEEISIKNNEKHDDDLEEEERSKESYNKSYNIKLSKEEVNKKFANKKAISSEDYAALEDNGSQDSYYSNKIKSMGNTQAISSSDLYGPQESDYTGESLTDKMKDFAINFTLKAAEKAKELKNKTNEMINKMQTKFAGNGSY